MKHDLDELMEQRNLDALVVSGKSLGNAALYYMINGAHVLRAIVIKQRHGQTTLIADPMERDEAQASGHPVVLSTRYRYQELLKQHQGDEIAVMVAYYRRIFEDLGVSGRVGFYGMADQGYAYVFLKALSAGIPEIEVVGEVGNTVLAAARATKDAAEVERIRDMGRRTAAVIRETIDFLQHHKVAADETLLRADGQPLTVGDVHTVIHQLIAAHALAVPEGFIFATGSDAGVPHNHGTAHKPIRLGESIVFDIYPCNGSGGYYYDMTRTFCLGYAPPAVAALYQTVWEGMQMVRGALQLGAEMRSYQQMMCRFFHERGHVTVAEDPATLNGYVHGLGHGVGLEVHELPMFSSNPSNQLRLQAGNIFTLEPGLYYPELGYGCRIEDVFYMDESGVAHNLAEYPYDLVVPML